MQVIIRLTLPGAMLFLAGWGALARADISWGDSGIFAIDNRGAEIQVFQRATGVFMAGVPFNNTFKAVVSNWAGSSPGTITFALNGQSVVIPYVTGGVETSAFDMGALPAGDSLTDSAMTVTARDAAGLRVAETSILLKCIKRPSFIPSPSSVELRSLSPLQWGQDVVYQANLGPLSPDLATTWYGENELFKDYGGTFSNGEMNIEFNGTRGEYTFDIRTDFTLSEKKPKLRRFCKPATNAHNISYEGENSLAAEFSTTATVSPFGGPIVCARGVFGYEWQSVPIRPTFGIPGLWFTGKASFDLVPELCFDPVQFSPDNPLPLTAVDVDLMLTGQGGLDLGIPSFVSVFGGLEGNASGKIHVLGDVLSDPIPMCDEWPQMVDLNFDFSLVGYGRLAFTEWEFSRFVITQWTCPMSGATYQNPLPLANSRPIARPAQRPYLDNGEPYAQFAGGLPTAGFGAETDELVTSNVNLEAAPAIAGRGNLTVVVTSEDDISNEAFAEHEIYAVFRDGGTWDGKLRLTSNSIPDVLPSVGFDASGKAIAAWTTIPGVSGSEEFSQVKSKMEIAWSAYDSSTQTWSTPVQLTSDGTSLDALTQIVSGGDGSTSLIWLSSPDNTLAVAPGEPMGNPVNVMVSRWNGSGFNAPAVLLAGCDAIAGVRYARDAAGTEYLVWTRDGDNDFVTLEDREIVESHTAGGTWTSPQALTGNQAVDTAVGLAVSPPGMLAYYVRAGSGGTPEAPQDELYTRAFDAMSWSAESVQFTAPAILSPSFAASAGNAVSCVWIGPSASSMGKGIFYSTSLTGLGNWSEPQEMGAGSGPAAASCTYAGINLQVGYMSARPAEGAQQLGFSLENALWTAFDVRLLDHTPYRDLWLETSDVRVQPHPPVPGQAVTISVTAHLAGDYEATGVELAAYQDDPSAGGILIGTTTVDMAPGAKVTAEIPWTYPTDLTGHAVYALLDSANAVSELVETNNAAHLPVSATNLTPIGIRQEFSAANVVSVELDVQNTGAGHAENVAYELKRDSVMGPVIASGTIPFIPAGQISERVIPWDVSATAAGIYALFLVVDPLGTIMEEDEDDNVATGVVRVQADLQLEPWSVRVQDQVARVVVKNTGSKSSQSYAVRASFAGEVLSEKWFGGLAAWGWREISLDVSGLAFGSSINFMVNPYSSGSDEVTLLNNTAIGVVVALADFDLDNDIDIDDLIVFNTCASGSAVPRSGLPDCQRADLDRDNDVDQDDFGLFQRCYSGSGMPVPSTCDK